MILVVFKPEPDKINTWAQCGDIQLLHSAGTDHALYFPAMVAGKYNPVIARFWQHLKAQNKPGKVIVVACMHKLLAIAYGVLRSGKPFDANYGKTACT